ncbi:MAG: DUF4845 domain-containing protein [Betaproteobacteria bacterium]|nr:DUF4845 domain-containing protein [Betaproteobacteria bacterium]
MKKNQLGVGMLGIMIGCIVIVLGAIGGLKIAPAYIEYFQIKKAVVALAQGGARGSVSEVRTAFDKRAQVDDITSVTSQDLEISKDGGDLVVSFAYPKKITLVSNVSLLIEFAGSSK